MLSDDHPIVLAELNRRAQVRAKADSKDTKTAEDKKDKKDGKKDKKDKDKEKEKDSDAGKWQITHQQLAESRYSDPLVKFVCLTFGLRFCFVMFCSIQIQSDVSISKRFQL